MSPSRPRTSMLAAVTVGLIAAGGATDPAAAADPIGTTGATTAAPADTGAAPATAPTPAAPTVPAPTTTTPPAAPTTTTDPSVADDPSVGDDSGGAGRDVEQARADRAARREKAERAKERKERREARERKKAAARKKAAEKAREEAAREAAEQADDVDASGLDAAASPLGGSTLFGNALPAIPGLFIDKFRIPPFLLPIYQAAGVQYGVPWEILAAINEIETDYGRNLNVSTAGAQGWMQFMPATWKTYGVDADGDGRADPMNPVDAIFAAARYLRAAGIEGDVRKAVFAYNHADWYVDSVLLRARLIGGLPSALVGSLTGLTEAQLPVAGLRAADAEQDDPATSATSTSGTAGSASGGGGSPSDGSGTDSAATAAGTASEGTTDPAGAAAAPSSSAPGAAGVTASGSTADRTSSKDPVWGPRRGDDRAAQITALAGTPVVAVQDATVVGLGTSETMGRWIRLRDVYGNRYTYAHLGALASTYAVPRSTAESVRRHAPSADPAPTAAASAGRQRAVSPAGADAPAGSAVGSAPTGSTATAPAAGASAGSPSTGPAPTAGAPVAPAGVAPPVFSGPPTALPFRGVPTALARPAVPAWAIPASQALALPGSAAASSVGSPAPTAVPATAAPTPSASPRSAITAPTREASGRTVDRALRKGSRVPGGTVLGTVGQAVRVTGKSGRVVRTRVARKKRASIAFGIRPAGDGAPRVDPQPFLDGWRLLAASSGTAADDRRKALFRPGTTENTPGQVLLLSKAQLQASVLDDDRLEIPAVGREQIRAGQIDRRVLATLAYLSASGHRVRVSSLRRPGAITVSGNVSEHDSGNAVDIAEVDGQTISPATQGPGTVTDRTIRLLLRLQGTTTPHQIISLMVPSDFGGASNVLAMADHADHIHVGFRVAVGDGAVLGRQFASALKPAQWDDLVKRLDSIGNPQVSPTASKFAVKVRAKKRR